MKIEMELENDNFRRIYWDEARCHVVKSNPEFANLIDELTPGKELYFYLAKYPYGVDIIEKGPFKIPLKGKNQYININDPQVPKTVFDDLGYNDLNHPVIMVLQGAMEMFLKPQDRIIPFAVAQKGTLFGLWKVLDQDYGFSHCLHLNNWGVTTGARSIFMLPKISEARSHNRLSKHFEIDVNKPMTLANHWQVFSEISQSSGNKNQWTTECLLFPKHWFENLQTDKWAKLHRYLLNRLWEGSSFWRNRFTWGFALSQIETKLGIKPTGFIRDIAKHLFAVATGNIPAFSTALNDELAPISLVQEAYVDIYRLNYAPIIMQPTYFSIEDSSEPVYFSLQYNTSLELSLKSAYKTSAIEDLYQLYSLMNKYLSELTSDESQVLASPLLQLRSLLLSYFHNEIDGYQSFQNISNLTQSDKNFKEISKRFNNLPAPESASFFKGCIRLSEANSDK